MLVSECFSTSRSSLAAFYSDVLLTRAFWLIKERSWCTRPFYISVGIKINLGNCGFSQMAAWYVMNGNVYKLSGDTIS